MLICICIGAGYVTYDLWLCIFVLDYNLKSGVDFLIHHVVGLIGAVAVLIAGRFNVALSCGQIVSEWTSFPMNFRWRMLKHKQTTGMAFMAMNVWFFFGYIACRMVFMGTLLLRNYQI